MLGGTIFGHRDDRSAHLEVAQGIAREYIRVNTMRGFAKDRNMRRDPRVTLLCYDRPSKSHHTTEVCG